MPNKNGFTHGFYSRTASKKDGFRNLETPKGGTVRTTWTGTRPSNAPEDTQYVGLVKV